MTDQEPIVSADPEPPDPEAPKPRPPQWVKVIIIAFGAAVLLVVGIALAWGEWLDARRADQCEHDVRVRDESRSMWVWLGAIQADSEEGQQFLADLRAELDVRLPRLDCDPDSNPIPVETTATTD